MKHHVKKITNIAEVVLNKTHRDNTPFQITPEGEGYYEVNGELIPMQVFHSNYPIDFLSYGTKGPGIDGRTNFYQSLINFKK